VTVSKGCGKKGLQVDYSEDIGISEGLDWKRALGLHFWFPASDDNFWLAIDTYEDAFKNDGRAPLPIPWYLDPSNLSTSNPVLNRWKLNPDQPTYDAIFHIIKIFVDPTYPLESVLEPRGFGPSPFDYRMPWHLYILLAKVLKLRDFEDREPIMQDLQSDSSDDASVSENISAWADLLTSQYADQLNKMGLLKWAGFVLLHLEHPEGFFSAFFFFFFFFACLSRRNGDTHDSLFVRRARALKELIFRNIKAVTVDVEEFFVKNLKIPSSWIYLARVRSDRLIRCYYCAYRVRLFFLSFFLIGSASAL
jgi:nuclear pore complex protein Nup98-Nup96